MNIREEIYKFSSDNDKSILLWLFDKYHFSSEWSFVAQCKFVQYGKYSYEKNRVWYPTKEGVILYNYQYLTNDLKPLIEIIITEFRESSLSGALEYREYWDIVLPKFLEETIKRGLS